jgi:hypothetical protein
MPGGNGTPAPAPLASRQGANGLEPRLKRPAVSARSPIRRNHGPPNAEYPVQRYNSLFGLGKFPVLPLREFPLTGLIHPLIGQ